MNKAELIEKLSAHYDGNKAEAARALNAVTETITHQTAAGEKVAITGFGVFEKVHRASRMVRNPRTGERKRAKATWVPRFRAGSELKAFASGEKKVPRAAKKAATKAPASKATATKAPAAKKATAKKTTAKKAPASKATATKAPVAKKTTAKKATATKSAAKKAPAKTAAKKTVAKKAPAKKVAAKKAPAKKAAAKKAPARKR
ncbi:HU family DNA-binding protein [Propionibacteriaceae bacterium Y1685]|uniref:HU family DNA-binding protein n=1 Tax=Microlunatus sp. Y1700 TaxID=3418487 RepID=UPI003B75EDB8